MGKEEKNIDDLFKQEANASVSNQYNNKYWEEYVQFKKVLITKKKKGFIIPFSILFLFFAGGLSMLFVNSNNQSSNENFSKTTDNTSLTLAKNTKSRTINLDDDNSLINSQKQNELNKDSLSSSTSAEINSIENRVPKNDLAGIKNEKILTDVNKKNKAGLEKQSRNKTPIIPQLPQNKLAENQSDLKRLNSNAVADKKDSIEDYKSKETTYDIAELSNKNDNSFNGSDIAQNSGVHFDDNEKTNSSQSNTEKRSKDELSEVIRPTIDDLITYNLLDVSPDTISYYLNQEDKELQNLLRDKQALLISGGVFTGANYNSNKPYLGIMLGGKYACSFTNKWTANVGANVQYKLTNKSEFIQSNFDYGLGYNEKKIINSFQNFLFLEAPISLDYKLTKKHKIGVQASYFYLIGFKKETSWVNRLFLGPEQLNTSKTQSETGYWDVFNRHDYGIGLNYGYQFNRKLSVNVGYLYGLTNVSNSKYIQKYDRNNQFKFWLEYKLK